MERVRKAEGQRRMGKLRRTRLKVQSATHSLYRLLGGMDQSGAPGGQRLTVTSGDRTRVASVREPAPYADRLGERACAGSLSGRAAIAGAMAVQPGDQVLEDCAGRSPRSNVVGPGALELRPKFIHDDAGCHGGIDGTHHGSRRACSPPVPSRW